MRQSIWKYPWTPACDSQLENIPWHPRATVNLKILLDTCVRQSIRKYSWTPACDSQFENIPGPRVQQSIWKYSWTPACDSELENAPGHLRATVNLNILLDTRVTVIFQRAFQLSAGLSHWKIGTRQMCMKWLLIIPHINSVNHVNSVNSVNSVNTINSVNSVNLNSANSYSAVLPPSPMVFLLIC